VKIAAGLTIAAGTYAGGWRNIRTLGQRIYGLQPEHGFAAQIAAGSTLWAGTHFGFPISTTHVVTGSVMGAGATRRLSAVRWGVAGNIVFAWLLTLPAAGLVAAGLYYPVRWIF
jgi:PiT family inorganic phosphate transporter